MLPFFGLISPLLSVVIELTLYFKDDNLRPALEEHANQSTFPSSTHLLFYRCRFLSIL